MVAADGQLTWIPFKMVLLREDRELWLCWAGSLALEKRPGSLSVCCRAGAHGSAHTVSLRYTGQVDLFLRIRVPMNAFILFLVSSSA